VGQLALCRRGLERQRPTEVGLSGLKDCGGLCSVIIEI
jgi:hypothetical protein